MAMGGTKSYGSAHRGSPDKAFVGKVDGERTGATSPEYNIYSDSEIMGSENENTSSGQKEGGE